MAEFIRLRIWDYQAAQRPDKMLSISKEVQRRCFKYYRRSSEVVYPPIVLENCAEDFVSREAGKYYLVVSRLVSYKKIDLAIEACNRLNEKLVIVGTGAWEKKLKKNCFSILFS